MQRDPVLISPIYLVTDLLFLFMYPPCYVADVLSRAHMVCSQLKKSKVHVHSLFAALNAQEMMMKKDRGVLVCMCYFKWRQVPWPSQPFASICCTKF